MTNNPTAYMPQCFPNDCWKPQLLSISSTNCFLEVSSKGLFPGQESLLRVTNSCPIEYRAGGKLESTELCSDLFVQRLSKDTLS